MMPLFFLTCYSPNYSLWRSLTCLVIFCSSLFLTGCGGNGNNAAPKALPAAADSSLPLITLPTPAALSAAEAARLQQACQAFFDTILAPKNFNGGIIVAKNGNIVFEKYRGTGFIGGFDSIKATSSLHIASVSKTFTAMATLRLQELGKLNIDEEVNKYLPTFNYPGVTIRSLLNHRSGLPNYTHFLESMGWDITKTISNEEMANFLISQKALMANTLPANVKFAYCNTNYALLAVLIEKVSGKKYADFLQQQFFTPLQMKNSFVYSPADSLTAIPSFDWKGRLMPFNYLDAVYGDKNIYSTPRDLLIWDRALSSGLLFTKETLAQAYAPYSNERPGMKNYGLGWRMTLFPNGKKIIFHNGWWHGNNAVFIRLLEEDATIIVLGNRFTRGVYAARQLANLFGDYNIPEEEGEEGDSKGADSVGVLLPGLAKDSIMPLRKKPMSKKDSALQRLFKDKHREEFEKKAVKMEGE